MGETFDHPMNIVYKKQSLKFLAAVNREHGYLVQLEPVETTVRNRSGESKHQVPIGVVWLPNRDLARRTEHATQYQRYENGMYDAVRGGWHIGQRYGIRHAKPGTEKQEVMRDREEIRRIVIQLMTSTTSLSERRLWLIEQGSPLIDEYVTKYDPRKIMVLQDVSRGMVLEDSLKRLNVGASGMAFGAAIGNLMEREKAIGFIDARVSQRTNSLLDEIRGVRDTCRVLWCGFRPGAAVLWAYEDAGRKPPEEREKEPGWLELVDRKSNWDSIARSLEMIQPALEKIQALPFRRLMLHTRTDVASAIRHLYGGEELRARADLVRLMEGLRWFFVLDFLQMRVITPLAMLEYDLRIEHSASPVPGGKPPKFVFTSKLDKTSFDDIRKTFEVWISKLDRCRDAFLASKVKNRIAVPTVLAAEAMAKDDWTKAKKHLLDITGIL